MRAHLEVIQRRTGVEHKALRDAPRLPRGCDELWQAFLRLHNRRGATGFGHAPITFADLHAYESVTGDKFARWEVEAICRADERFLGRKG